MPPLLCVTNASGWNLAARLYYLWKPRADTRTGLRREDGMPPPLCVANACEEKLAAQLRIPKPHCGENRMPPPCNALYADCRCE